MITQKKIDGCMQKDDLEFLAEILERSDWLFYGDLDEHLDDFLRRVFKHDLRDWGFGEVEMTSDFAVSYWLLLSSLVALDLAEYGTSPRGAWLTESGERFKALCLAHKNAIQQANEYIYNKYR